MEPTMVPASALDTVTPSASGERWKRSVSACVVPEITTVSKPNSSPPSAATTVLRRRTEFNGIVGTFQQSCPPTILQSADMERLCQRGILVDSLVRRENYFLEGARWTQALTTLESRSRVGYRFQGRSEARKVGFLNLAIPCRTNMQSREQCALR